MPLIKCTECGIERSNQVGSACPKCGHVIGAEEEQNKKEDYKEKLEQKLIHKSSQSVFFFVIGFIILCWGLSFESSSRYIVMGMGVLIILAGNGADNDKKKIKDELDKL